MNPLTDTQGKQSEYSPEQFSAYYLELERLLDRAENACTHYEVLDLERSAELRDVRLAYHKALQFLYPAYAIAATVPEAVLTRIEQAFEKISKSFSVLAHPNRRDAYDLSLRQGTGKLRMPVMGLPDAGQPKTSPLAEPGRMPVESGRKPAASNRRKQERHKLSIAVNVTGYDRETGRWRENTKTLDVSQRGARFLLRRHVPTGLVLHLTMPLPVSLRAHGLTEETYKVYALVRRAVRTNDEMWSVGVEFMGESPPNGYLERPWTPYQAKNYDGSERRRHARASVADVVFVEYFNKAGNVLAREMARAENLSQSGMRVCVRSAPEKFAFIRVNCSIHGLEKFAALVNRYRGKDGHERLSLRFVGD
ncbi:MAG TPA: PilZ domain-containing protein [Blastocatellia bacterium]|nr:PilZ domain-containing protein [Blastocatellia bacterium]